MSPLALGRRSFVALLSLPVPALAQVQGSAQGPAQGSATGPAAGLLVIGQAPAQAFLQEGGLRTLTEGLATMLRLPAPRFEPGFGLRRPEAYALPAGVLREPAAFSLGPAPLWEPGNPRALLQHRPEEDPLQWPRGAAGQALGRFVRTIMSAEDRARCLGILWLTGLTEAPPLEREQIFLQAQAMRRHLTLLRADFGRPATGPEALPAFLAMPQPGGPPGEAQLWFREAMSEVLVDSEMNTRLVMPQAADLAPRAAGETGPAGPGALALLGRRAAYGIFRELGGSIRFPGPGPRISSVEAPNPFTTEIIVALDRGRSLVLNGSAGDGRGWSVTALGEPRQVHSIQRSGPARLLLRHQVAAPRRTIGYCLFGERLGAGNGITDDWGRNGELPPGLGPDWLIDLPLQATLKPFSSG